MLIPKPPVRTSKVPLSLGLLLISVIACTTSAPPSPQASVFPGASLPVTTDAAPGSALPPNEGSPSAPTDANATAQTSAAFRVAVIVDTTAAPVTREQAAAVLGEASSFLRQFSPIPFEMADFVEDGRGGATADMANRYVAEHPGALPNGLVIFSYGDNGQARTGDGYGYTVPGPSGFRNAFASPAGSNDQIYVAVVDFDRKYMACGYGGGDTLQSSTSLAGECRGQTGLACISTNGYSMCPDAAGNQYTSTPTHYVSSMIIHGLLHNFAPGGDQDHYATPECNARMGYPAGFFDLQESEYYNGLCPFVYEDFTKSYRP